MRRDPNTKALDLRTASAGRQRQAVDVATDASHNASRFAENNRAPDFQSITEALELFSAQPVDNQ